MQNDDRQPRPLACAWLAAGPAGQLAWEKAGQDTEDLICPKCITPVELELVTIDWSV